MNPEITKTIFRSRFPRLFLVRAIDRYEAEERGLSGDRTWWLYMADFEFVSSKWGSIVVPEGMITDFASVPKIVQSVYPNDDPILLYPSAAHDLLFQPRPDGSRGWLADGRQLSLEEANEVLIEGMFFCGASVVDRVNVKIAVEIGNLDVKHRFRSE